MVLYHFRCAISYITSKIQYIYSYQPLRST